MKKSFFLFFVFVMVLQLYAQNNVITYTADAKLDETTNNLSSGLHMNAFNVSVVSHVFSAGNGTITFSGDVTTIGEWAFARSHNLTSITIPNTVTSVGYASFFDCIGIVSFFVPESVISIGTNAFAGCTGLTSFIIPEGVTNIESSTFSGCSNLALISIPEGVDSIGISAFWNCSSLSSVSIPNSVKFIGDCAFKDCSLLDSIFIPRFVSKIGEEAFSNCPLLTSIQVESSNPVYDSRSNCNAIIESASNILIAGCKNSYIPYGIHSIGNSAFLGCIGLASITIPESVTSIGMYAFQNCTSLSSISIPRYVANIGAGAFWSCSSLTSISCLSLTPPTLGMFVFESVSRDIPLYVPAASVTLYQTADQWNEFGIQPLLVEIAPISPDTTNLTWLPVDSAAMYQLHIYSNQTAFDTTLLILANPDNGGTRLQTASSKRQHRIVLGDEIGTLVVIVFDDNTGTTTDEPFVVSVSTTSDGKIDIHYDMRVLGVTDNLIRQDSGMFTLNDGLPDAIEKVYISSLPTGIYDLYGRRYPAEAWESLPAGVYVVREEDRVEKVMKK